MASSPYVNLPPDRWKVKTEELIAAHPLSASELVEAVVEAWNSIFASRLGTKGYRIGTHIFPKPQIMGFFLHELIPLELADRHPGIWRVDQSGRDKDLVHIPDERFSVEIKTSSHRNQVFGNRSYAQPSSDSKKSKAGYYLAVNFEKFGGREVQPRIVGIRFGWLDHSDWIAQRAATGQQARLAEHVYGTKLLQLFPNDANS